MSDLQAKQRVEVSVSEDHVVRIIVDGKTEMHIYTQKDVCVDMHNAVTQEEIVYVRSED